MRRMLAKVGDEAGPVGIVGMDPAIGPKDQRVGRPDRRGAVGNDPHFDPGGFEGWIGDEFVRQTRHDRTGQVVHPLAVARPFVQKKILEGR